TLLGVLHAAGQASEARTEAESRAALNSLVLTLVLTLVGMGIAGSCMWLVVVRVTRPLSHLANMVKQVADEEARVDVAELRRNGEVGAVARAVEELKVSLIERRRLAEERKESDDRQARRTEMHKLAEEFEGAVGGVVNAVGASAAQLESAAG